jgi:DNA-directed RNA polymerase specialized sigma24 family protein
MDARLLADQIPSLRRYARALTGNAWAADDLVQDTLERACSKWRLWVVGSDLRAWLFTVMHNIFASQLRRTPPPHSVVPLEDATQELHGAADPGRDPGMGLDLQRCLMQLPEEQRAVLLLAIPAGTVMSRLSRARVRLHELMDGASAPHRPGLRRLK